MKISGQFFQPLSSKSQVSTLLVANGEVQIEQEDGQVTSNLKIEVIQDSKNIQFKCGSYFRSDEVLPPEFLKMFQTSLQRFILWLEKISLTKVIVLILLLVVAVVGYRLVFTSIGNSIALIFPDSWEEEVGENAYQSMKLAVFSQSEISVRYQDQIRHRAQDIASGAGLSRSVEIIFHDSEVIGPNAMAFPGGPVVITDGLVNLLSSDEELLAVIAHEFAHIEERHSLKRVLEIIGVSILASMLFGSNESITDELSAVLIGVWAFKNSRDFEKEADLRALQYLEASNLDPQHFVSAIKKLIAFQCGESTQNAAIYCEEGALDWVSTHPAGSERIDYLMNAIR